MKTKIEKLDDYGRGICFIDNKITFVKNALIGEEVEIEIKKEYSKYNEAIVTNYITKSKSRIENDCPYYNQCGGCHLRHMNSKEEELFKINKVKNVIKKFSKLEIEPTYISVNESNYRNKVSLKVKNKEIGYFAEKTHHLIKIDNCKLIEEQFNNIIKKLYEFNIINGSIIMKTNYNQEIVIMINTLDTITIPDNLEEHKVLGIVLNKKIIKGEGDLIDIVNKTYYQIGYNSFFQINRDVTSKLLENLNNDFAPSKNTLDLYCGVGTIGLSLHKKIENIYGIELVKSAIYNAYKNSKINKIYNTSYHLGKAEELTDKLNIKFDTVIVDPPREGLDKITIQKVLDINPKQLIYMSCDVHTLARDLNILKDQYEIKDIKCYNMFPRTYHVECLVTLCRK